MDLAASRNQPEMDHVRPQDSQQGKSSVSLSREPSGDSDRRSSDRAASPSQEKRPFRRVPSPTRPRARLHPDHRPELYRPRFYRDNHSFHKPSFNYRGHHLSHRPFFYRKDALRPRMHHDVLRERERERDQREPSAGSSSKPSSEFMTLRASSGRSTSSRDKDVQTSEREPTQRTPGTSRDEEVPATLSQTAARDRAIQQKRKEIDEVYFQECEMFGLVVKMLIEKDPSLEGPIQSSLQENLREIGSRCVKAMERFIAEYDSNESAS